MAGRRIRGNPPSLDARALSQLQQRAPTPDQILEHMDDLNEEIAEQAAAKGVELEQAAPVPAIEDDMDAEDELDRLNKELEQKLAKQKELQAQRAEAEAQAAAEAAPVAAPPEETPIEDQVRQMLMNQKNAPSATQIARWKQQYGQDAIQVLAMGTGDVYVFTYLRRASFQKIQAAVAKQAQLENMSKDPEEFMMEQVLSQCVLWPKIGVEFFYQSRSGVMPTLYSSIMLHSYHLTPQQAMVITAQL